MKKTDISIISDDRIFNYLEDNMTGAERSHYEKEALLTGELRELQQMRHSIYNAHLEYANELLGEDDFNLDSIFNNTDSATSGKSAVWNPDLYLRLAGNVKSLIDCKPSEKSCQEHLVDELMKSHISMSRLEAELTIDQIMAGVDKFNIDFATAVKNDTVNDFSIFKSEMENMSLDKKCSFLANAIIILRAANNKLGEEYKSTTFEEYHRALYDDLSPSQELLDKLTAMCKDEMESCQIPEAFIDGQAISNVTDNAKVDASVRGLLKQKETAYYLGYILYEEKMNVEGAEDVDPYIIGLSAASSTKQAELIAASENGEIPETKLQKFIKMTVAVAVFSLVAYLILTFWLPYVSVIAPMLVSAGAGFFLNLFMGLSGLILLGIATLCTIFWSFTAAGLSYMIMGKIMEWLGNRKSTVVPDCGNMDQENEHKMIEDDNDEENEENCQLA